MQAAEERAEGRIREVVEEYEKRGRRPEDEQLIRDLDDRLRARWVLSVAAHRCPALTRPSLQQREGNAMLAAVLRSQTRVRELEAEVKDLALTLRSRESNYNKTFAPHPSSSNRVVGPAGNQTQVQPKEASEIMRW